MAWRGGAEVGEVALQGLTYAQRLGLLALVQQSRDGAGGHRLPGVDDFHLSWGWAGCAGCQGRPGGCQASQHTTTARAGLWASALTPGTVSPRPLELFQHLPVSAWDRAHPPHGGPERTHPWWRCRS